MSFNDKIVGIYCLAERVLQCTLKYDLLCTLVPANMAKPYSDKKDNSSWKKSNYSIALSN